MDHYINNIEYLLAKSEFTTIIFSILIFLNLVYILKLIISQKTKYKIYKSFLSIFFFISIYGLINFIYIEKINKNIKFFNDNSKIQYLDYKTIDKVKEVSKQKQYLEDNKAVTKYIYKKDKYLFIFLISLFVIILLKIVSPKEYKKSPQKS